MSSPGTAQTAVMGILNVTPDSFSDGGRYYGSSINPGATVDRALEIERQGAAIIDIGGESTRPGSARIGDEEELARVVPVLKQLRERLTVPFSIDTRSPLVAERALALGASYINCIAVDGDAARTADICRLAVRSGTPLILTHVRGALESMHRLPPMADAVEETYQSLRKLAAESGLPKEQLLLDPGIGFGKNGAESYRIMRHLDRFRSLGHRLVVGTSRKRFLSSDPSGDSAEDRDFATAATVAILALQRCDIVRVHNVLAMSQVVEVVRRYLEAGL